MNQESWEISGRAMKVFRADSFLTRLKGLMFHAKLPEDTGLFIVPCSSIHMCFMRFSIDAVYLDEQYRILKVVHHLHPWIGLSMCRGAWGCLELTAGAAEAYGLEKGQRLSLPG